jgi:hypothetical protein
VQPCRERRGPPQPGGVTGQRQKDGLEHIVGVRGPGDPAAHVQHQPPVPLHQGGERAAIAVGGEPAHQVGIRRRGGAEPFGQAVAEGSHRRLRSEKGRLVD